MFDFPYFHNMCCLLTSKCFWQTILPDNFSFLQLIADALKRVNDFLFPVLFGCNNLSGYIFYVCSCMDVWFTTSSMWSAVTFSGIA
jgi:hypothetical protein